MAAPVYLNPAAQKNFEKRLNSILKANSTYEVDASILKDAESMLRLYE